MTTTTPNPLGFTFEAWRDFFAAIGEKPFRAQQMMQWIHQMGVSDYQKMSNIGKALQAKLTAMLPITVPEIIVEKISTDGTRKWLMRVEGGSAIEIVFIPEAKRGTLCVSSQVGCALTCTFCSTAKQGFNRNLTTAEIIGQVWHAVRALSKTQGEHDHQVTNVVMMGMGEPLLNFDNVVDAMNIMMHDLGYGLSKRRVTLSTSGVLPYLEKLREVSPVALAVSLHAPNDTLRDEIVPINKKYPLADLMALCKRYYGEEKRRKVTFEYVMLNGVNDSSTHAKELIKLLKDVPSKVNLIPFNPFPMTPYTCSPMPTILAFQKILMENGIYTSIRKTRGDDIDAACGQLAGKVNDRTSRSNKWQVMRTAELAE